MGAAGSEIRDLLDKANVASFVDSSSWAAVRRAFQGVEFDQWVDGLQTLVARGLRPSAIMGFVNCSPICAKAVGGEAALALVPALIAVHGDAGPRATSALSNAAPHAAKRLAGGSEFHEWLQIVVDLAKAAPESVELVLDRTDAILSRLDLAALRGWIQTGLRSTARDPERRIAYFSMSDSAGLRAFEQASSDIVFSDVERRLSLYVSALWGLRPIIRTAPVQPGRPAPRRTSFEGAFVRIPETYSGFHGDDALRLYRAALTHAAAHMAYGGPRFPVGTLKPIQIALVSLIEDARIETLASSDFPGLRRLWAGFHIAVPHTALSAEMLLPRLARALIDPAYRDSDPWVSKGRMMFVDHRSQWADPMISRRIGGLLGNDLGQMRVQFNARTYVVEPPYRDDNHGLWDYGEPPPQQSDEAETIIDAVRIRQTENEADPHHRRRNLKDGDLANRAAQVRALDEDAGVPVAKYPEWDHFIGRERAEWTTIMDFVPRRGPSTVLDGILHDYADVEYRIAKLIRSARVSQPWRVRRQPEGDRLDLEACIRSAIDYRSGISPDPHVYETRVLRSRDLSVLLLLDISESTKDRIRGAATSVLSVERAASVLLAQALHGLHDPFAIHAFCSNGRNDVRYFRIKDFGRPYDGDAMARLAGLRGGFSTRIGAALRHAGALIAGQQTHRRLILVVTDGEPSDIDVSDRKYLVEDARKAVQGLAHGGIDVFCVGLDSGGESYLDRIFGRRNYIQIKRVEALPEKLPMLYFRLTK